MRSRGSQGAGWLLRSIFAAVAACAFLAAGCARPLRGFEGAWAYCMNGHAGAERYLFIERAGKGYLVALVDRARGELEDIGVASLENERLVARMDGGATLRIERDGASELRAYMAKPLQAEDIGLVFYPADADKAGGLP